MEVSSINLQINFEIIFKEFFNSIKNDKLKSNNKVH